MDTPRRAVDAAPPTTWDATRAAAALDRELRLVEDGVAYVASGAGPRITIAGLTFGNEIIDRARQVAGSAGLRVRPLYGSDEHRLDLIIERRPTMGEPGSEIAPRT